MLGSYSVSKKIHNRHSDLTKKPTCGLKKCCNICVYKTIGECDDFETISVMFVDEPWYWDEMFAAGMLLAGYRKPARWAAARAG